METAKIIEARVDNATAEEQITDLKMTLAEADKINSDLRSRIAYLEKTIVQVNNSKAEKILKAVKKVRFIWATAGGGGSFLNRILFFFSPLGIKLVVKVLKGCWTNIFRKKRKCEIDNESPYQCWVRKNYPGKDRLGEYGRLGAGLRYKPYFTIICRTGKGVDYYDSPLFRSLKDQVYDNWELLVLGESDNFPAESMTSGDKLKILFCKGGEDISVNISKALKLASGEFISIMPSMDRLAPHALYTYADFLNNNPEADLLYSDEENGGPDGPVPVFKPDWCPDNLLSTNYIGNAVFWRTNLVRSLGDLTYGAGSSINYDVSLRASEKSSRIFHISDILYHRYCSDFSVSDHYTHLKTLRNAIGRRDVEASVETVESGVFKVLFKVKDYKKVSVIIPTRDKADVLEKCLHSIAELTVYPDYEVIIVDNNSSQSATFELFKKYSQRFGDRFKVLKFDEAFNYSRINNYAVKHAVGDYLLFLNNDTEVLHADWMELMVQQVQRTSIGAVGVRLLFPDRKIQHAGMVIGLEYGGNTFLYEDEMAGGYLGYIRQTRNYSAVTAACLMCRREVFEKVGGFEESFAVEFNDSDLCLKMKEAGYNNIYLPHVSLIHYESLSRGYVHLSKKSYERHLQDKENFSRKWGKYLENDPCYNKNLSKRKAGFTY
jgi:O-antigen biosynthesis protein